MAFMWQRGNRYNLGMSRLQSGIKLAEQFILSILIIAGMTAILWLLREHLSIEVVALLYLLPVVLSTRLWGLAPGILSAACGFLSLNYFFIPPLYTLAVHRNEDLLMLIVFLVNAVVISQLLGRVQYNLQEATRREQEATHLYELSIALAGLHEQTEVMQFLAQKLKEIFCLDRVEIEVNPPNGLRTVYSLPVEGGGGMGRSQLVLNLLTARGELGRVQLWRLSGNLDENEQRLLKTFVNQGTLALERAILFETERRTRMLEDSDRLKSALLSSVSHELRSPLATIKASVSSLRSGEVDWQSDARLELLSAVEEETDHLNLLVGNLLDMSRIETGALNPERKWNALADIAGGVVKRMQLVLQRHRVELQIPDDLPLVPVDYIQIEQVFSNLLSNSAKYAPEGTVITICAELQDQEVRVQVSNQGPPVPAEYLDRIFDKFNRVTAADRITGTGLGLSICKGIIEAHGGRIWAENQPGGFVFKFTLPTTMEGLRPLQPREVKE
jgi:two-component system, OmpR family, sensor histidine kinase KdpD